MKSYRNLYPKIHQWETLETAYRKARRGKRSTAPVADFEMNWESHLLQLERELAAKSYRPGEYHSFSIREAKKRLISAAPFRDRVVHHALCLLIEPIFERQFIYHSYANRIGKGTHRALDHCTKLSRGYDYVLPCDIRQHFPSIDHEVLRNILARPIACPDTRWLIDRILASGEGILTKEYDMVYFPGDDLLAATRPRGLPIGNLTSQFWSNCYLNPLDHFVKETLRCRGYLRYVDDFLLFGNSKKQLWQWRSAIIEFLQSLRLKIHESRAEVQSTGHGIPFLGFIVRPYLRRLKRYNLKQYRSRLKWLWSRYRAGQLPREAVEASLRGWLAHISYGNTFALAEQLLQQYIF